MSAVREFQAGRIAVGTALMRVALGAMYLAHGTWKVVTLTLPVTAAFFEQHGFPGWSAYAVAGAEVVGGLLLVAGVETRKTVLALLPVLLGALAVHWSNGWVFVSAGGGWEYPAFLIVASLAQALQGDGALTWRPTPAARPAHA